MYKNFLFIVALLYTSCVFAQNSVEFVDLGLPSGTLWADRNVGAKSPEDYGNYYAWGETETKKEFNWSTYKFRGERLDKKYGVRFYKINKYINKDDRYAGVFDKKYELDREDEVASLTYGGDCRMPNSNDLKELLSFCTWIRSEKKGVRGYIVIGNNGNSIFIPSGGGIGDKKNYLKERYPELWTSTLSENLDAFCLSFQSTSEIIGPSEITLEKSPRSYGLNVRAVKPSRPTPTPVADSAPTLTFDSPVASAQSTYKLRVKVNSSSAITNTKVLVNGQAERGVTPVKNDGAQFVISKSLTLKEGNNTILVEVTNAAGTASMNTVVNYTKSVSNNVVVVPSNQQKCIALVIGNSNYAKATSLTNPANDAKDVASKLKSLGFTVIEREDLGLRQFNEAVSDFGTKAAQYDVALFYYAGHAIENEGVNYLIPVDATLEKRVDLPYQCVNAQYVLDNLEESQSKANIIILDACRNNPIERGWSRSLSGGLAQMIAPTGTFFMFSTSPGRTADDGVGRNSPFTQAFLSCLDIPNIQLEIFAKEVIRKVKDNTNNRQIPWSSSSFYGDFYFNKK